MKRFARYALLCHLLMCGVAASRVQAQRDPQVRVELSADKTELPVNDNVTVRVYVQAQGAGQPDIEVPEFEGFQIVQRAVQRPMQFSFGFGQSQPVVTSTTQYTFVLVPMGAGTFKIPPVKVTLGQRVFQSKPLVLTVTGQAQGAPRDNAPQQAPQQPGAQPLSGGSVREPTPSGNAATPAPQASGDVAIYDNEAFLRTVVDKLEPYEGEQVTATIYLYARHNLQQVPAVQAEASTDGFWVQDLLSATRSLEPTRQVINGRGFWVYVLRRFAAFPLKGGELTIGSMALTISRETMFDLFNPTSAPAEVERKSVPVLLKVKPLPAEGRPPGPIAVGSFEIKSALDRAQVATGDAVTWTATLKGRGNLRAIKLPEPAVPGLQVLQPEVHDLTETPQDRVQSTRSFAWLVVPQQPGTYTLPALTLDTFDPATGAYKRISSERLTLTAAGAAPAGMAQPTPGDKPDAHGEDAEDRSETWPPLHTHSALSRGQTPLSAHGYYPLLLLLWPLLWLGISYGPSSVSRWRARGQGTAEQMALRAAHQKLKHARHHGAQDARVFHAEIAAALNTALEARIGENVSGLTQSQLRRRLAELGIPDKLGADACEVLSQCDFARFSSAAVNADEMQRLLARAEHIWGELASFVPEARKESA